MPDARIELLQQMPIFGGIRTETLQFLIALCPIVSVSKNDFFFREHEDGDSMFVLKQSGPRRGRRRRRNGRAM